ncbi:MAG TPA: cytochrome c biogenesis protein CcdA [Patescibacteria group bacterium]|nr:cytochrome c biogenesis protein CcdA [Patescibacteria group bacterium]
MHLPVTAIAYLAGLLSFFAPCGAVLLPSFFAYTFKKRTALVAATCWFLAGFMTLFVPVGLGIRALAMTLSLHRPLLSWIGGIGLFALAGLALAGKGLHVPAPAFLRIGRRHDEALSAYLIGVVFGFTIAGCTAPLLGLALAYAALSGGTLSSVGILLAYGFGLATPLFALSFAADRTGFLRHRFFRGIVWSFRFLGKERTLHSTNLAAAALLAVLGAVFIATQGTFFMSYLDSRHGLADFNTSMARILSTWRR